MHARVVVLNWNGRQWLGECLTALASERREGVEVVVVDNGSSDGSVAFVRAAFPWTRVLALASNTGFARGNNLGAEGSAAAYLVFLNNDTRIAAGSLGALIAHADADPAVGLVASRIEFQHPAGVIDSAGDGYLRCGGAYKIGHGSAAPARDACDVFGACGAGFLIRRTLFERLGGFDERFFMVYEDVDLSYRARLVGARVRYAPDAVVYHASSASLGATSDAAVFYGQRNLEWVWLQNTPTRLLWRSCVPHLAYTVASGLAYARAGRSRPWLRAKLAALRGLGGALAARRRVQATRTVNPERLWSAMDGDWVGIKRREKRFQFGRVRRGQPPRNPGT